MYEFHPLAEVFPLLGDSELAELRKDIFYHGQREPIVLFENKILDGRNRYLACLAAGIQPKFSSYAGNDPVGYVVSLNLRRRHLDESQRAMVAAKLATLKDGQRQVGKFAEVRTQPEAARLLNVSDRSVRSAKTVLDEGAPELVQAVERGAASVSAAADIASLPQSEQAEIVARGEKEILAAAKQIRSERAEARREERTKKLIELSNANSPLPQDRKYPIIYADPPWQYDHPLSSSREIENHYGTMSLEDIRAFDVAGLSTPDAMLFLWCPAPLLVDRGLPVLEAWGFRYRTHAVWDKQTIGMGIYVRQQHETLLIASRGTPIVPDPSSLSPSVISAPRGRHSEKPVEAYEMIERMYPGLPKIELFARNRRAGFDCWGNEVTPLLLEAA